MPSLRVAAIAAFASMASAQFSNSTLPTAITVPGWTYEGCAISTLAAGTLVETSPFQTVERCLLDCSAYTFAFIQGQNCYCATSNAGVSTVSEAQCAARCPGNPAEACGGALAGAKRQAVGTVVSVYEQQAIVPVGVVYTTVINNIYIDYCPEEHALTTVTYCSTATLTGCGCTDTPKPTIPVKTVTTECDLGSTKSVVTLTCPTAVTIGQVTKGQSTVITPVTTVVACPTCPAGSATTTVSACPGCATSTVATAKPAVYTGAADSLKVGSGLIAGAAAIAALL